MLVRGLLFGLLVCVSGFVQAIVITNPNPVTNEEVDPHLNDPTFLSGVTNSLLFDFSGVGRSTAANSQWGTMITPDQFITANHARPNIGDTYEFFGPTGAVIATHTVASGQRVGASEAWIGKFTTSVDTTQVQVYDLAAALAAPTNVIMVGVGGSTDPFYRVGQNRVDQLLTTTVFAGTASESTSEFALHLDNSATGGLGDQAGMTFGTVEQYETVFGADDSGGPSFVNAGGGDLELIGVHSFFADVSLEGDPMTAERRASFDAHLPSINAEIVAIITAVPEPSTLMPLALFSWCLITRRKR